MATRPDFLREYVKVQRTYDPKTRAVMEAAATDIAKRIRTLIRTGGVGDAVRAAQLRLVLKAINDELGITYRGPLTGVVIAGQKAAAEAAQEAADDLDSVVYRSIGDRAVNAFLRSFQAQARKGIATDAARRRKTLSKRVLNSLATTADDVEQIVRTGLVAGDGPRDLAQRVYRHISPTTPGGASYAALRLARTEINNAYHDHQKTAGDKPWVKGVRWNLSGSHPRPDDCNKFADQNKYRLGKGLYPAGKVPDKPHPQCLCFLTYDMMSPEEFVSMLDSDDRVAG